MFASVDTSPAVQAGLEAKRPGFRPALVALFGTLVFLVRRKPRCKLEAFSLQIVSS